MSACLIIADDHPLFRAALKQAVQGTLAEARVIDAASMEQLEAAVAAESDADLVLLDLHMPGARGFSSLAWLRSQHPEIPVIVVSAQDDARTIRRAADFDAAGFLSKSTPLDDMQAAIRTVLDGHTVFPELLEEDTTDAALAARMATLTPQQFRVFMRLADGALNKQIAYDLNVSEATIKAHMTAILRKLGLYSRTQAAVLAHQLQADGSPPPHAVENDSSDAASADKAG